MKLTANFNSKYILVILVLSCLVRTSLAKTNQTEVLKPAVRMASFFDEKLNELESINFQDKDAKNAIDIYNLLNKKSYAACGQKALESIKEAGVKSAFFSFEFVFGVKCLLEINQIQTTQKKLFKEWADYYFSIDFEVFKKDFHGAEAAIVDHQVLDLSEILFLNLDFQDLKIGQVLTLERNLKETKNIKVKKQLVLNYLNRNDQASAKNFLLSSDPLLINLDNLEILLEHFKDDVYSSRIAEIKKSKNDSLELKRMYQRNQTLNFLELLAQTNLVLEDEIDLASRQAGWLFVRAKEDIQNKMIDQINSLDINPHEFFWVLSNQGYFKQILAAYANLDEKKQTANITMALKAYLYSGQYDLGYKFVVSKNFESKLNQTRDAILFYSALIYLRANKDKEALPLLSHLALSDSEYKLQAMYLNYNVFKDLNRVAYKKEAQNIVSFYPLTFFGLLVAHKENLTSSLPFMQDTPEPKLVFNFEQPDEKRKLKHLVFVYENKLDHRFRKFTEATLNSLFFESQLIWAYYFNKIDKPLHAIKVMNHVWTSRRDWIHASIIPIAYPKDYLKEVKKHSVSGIDPFLVLGLIRQESAFQKNAQSPSNARGLMQLLTATAREMAKLLRVSKTVSLPWGLYSPEVNIRLGSFYLKKRVEAYKGHVPLALASYNVGPGRLQKWSLDRNLITESQENIYNEAWKSQDLWVEELPWDETRFYVKAVLRNYLLYALFEDYKPFSKCYRLWNCGAVDDVEDSTTKNSASSEAKSI